MGPSGRHLPLGRASGPLEVGHAGGGITLACHGGGVEELIERRDLPGAQLDTRRGGILDDVARSRHVAIDMVPGQTPRDLAGAACDDLRQQQVFRAGVRLNGTRVAVRSNDSARPVSRARQGTEEPGGVLGSCPALGGP